MFESGVILTAGGILAVALLDKFTEAYGFKTVGTVVKLLLPIAGILASIYLMDVLSFWRWLR